MIIVVWLYKYYSLSEEDRYTLKYLGIKGHYICDLFLNNSARSKWVGERDNKRGRSKVEYLGERYKERFYV